MHKLIREIVPRSQSKLPQMQLYFGSGSFCLLNRQISSEPTVQYTVNNKEKKKMAQAGGEAANGAPEMIKLIRCAEL
jgi:hypothetical protein